MESHQSAMWTALPGMVVSVNLTAQTVSVQPTIQGQMTAPDGSVQLVNLPLLVDVPIVWPRAGGFALTFPVTIGDEVLVVFASRCIDSWYQSGGIAAPAESRMHDLSDGFAILAPTSQPRVLANVQTDGMELRNESRSTFIKLTETGIVIQGNITHIGNQTSTGTTTMTGAINLTGNVVHSGGTLASLGKNISGTHTHSGVQTGSGSTGVPN